MKNNFKDVSVRTREWLEDTGNLTRFTLDKRLIELPIGEKWKCNILEYSRAFPRRQYDTTVRVKFQREFWNWLEQKNVKASIKLIKTEFRNNRNTVFIKIHESKESVEEVKFQISLGFL